MEKFVERMEFAQWLMDSMGSTMAHVVLLSLYRIIFFSVRLLVIPRLLVPIFCIIFWIFLLIVHTFSTAFLFIYGERKFVWKRMIRSYFRKVIFFCGQLSQSQFIIVMQVFIPFGSHNAIIFLLIVNDTKFIILKSIWIPALYWCHWWL